MNARNKQMLLLRKFLKLKINEQFTYDKPVKKNTINILKSSIRHANEYYKSVIKQNRDGKLSSKINNVDLDELRQFSLWLKKHNSPLHPNFANYINEFQEFAKYTKFLNTPTFLNVASHENKLKLKIEALKRIANIIYRQLR